ncbi:MAG: DUF6465 family protein [Lachnospiraceae bacterium]|nr:DUF6465 family protein [Lachnospiraceae bacterium]
MARPRRKTNTTVNVAAEVKPAVEEAVKKVEETVEAAAKTTEEAAKAATGEVKTAVKKAVKKAPAKKEKEPAKTNVILQFGGNGEADLGSLEEKVKAQFVAEGHRAGCIRNLDIYVKPEDGKAYYVINNGKFSGDINLF